MSEPFVFDPRYGLCKSPFGAAACGTTVSLHCRPLASEGFTHCALVIHREFSGQCEERELYQDGVDGERIRFSLSFASPAVPGAGLVSLPLLAGRRHGLRSGQDRLPQRRPGRSLAADRLPGKPYAKLVRQRCCIPNFSRSFLPSP